MKSEPILAWHFLPQDGCIANRKSKRKVKAGDVAVHRGQLELCHAGLHASVKARDALGYAPGPIVCRVECSGEILHGKYKFVCTQRKVLWLADATRTLHEFAIWCAEQALALVENPDPRSLKALEVKKLWLDGLASDEELETARAAAWAAEAGYSASCAAAAATAAYVAAWAAWTAWAAETAAYAGAGWAAARENQNVELERRLMALAPKGGDT